MRLAVKDEQNEKLNLLQKLAKIRKVVEVLQKDRQAYGYKYVTEEQILSRITGLMDKLGISLIPGIVPGTTSVEPYHCMKTKATKDGKIYEEHVNEILVRADTTWTWVDNANPEDNIKIPWSLVGQQSDASQAFGSGLSYSSRYFLLKYFNVSTTEDDPDNWRSKQHEAENAEQIEIAKGIVEQIRKKLGQYIAKHPDAEKDVVAVIKQFVVEKGKPSANYLAIKDPVVASNLQDALNKQFPDD